MEIFLPFWIIGAPLAWAAWSWFSTPQVTLDRSDYRAYGSAGEQAVKVAR